MSDRLSVTSYGVLGLLTFGEMSGYDLNKLADRSIGHFWTPARSQIYADLKRLARAGLVTERRVAQEARPDKRLYSLTEEGRAALEGWLADPAFEPDQVRSVTMMKVFFGAHAPRDTLIARLKEVIAHNEGTVAYLRAVEADIEDRAESFYPYLTVKAGLLHTVANITWATEVLEVLEGREVGWAKTATYSRAAD